MKAVVYTKYGSPDVLQLKEVDRPTPKDNELLIRLQAAALNAADGHLLRGKPLLLRLEYGLLKPKRQILGADIAGRVEAVGRKVKALQPGDEVFGDLSGCGFGGFAEYVAVPEHAVVLKPEGMTFEQAAATPMAAVTALQGLRDKGKIQPGHKVLIYGASGGVGTFAVQLAKVFGADVTAVCSSSKVELVRSLGADHVIDYRHEDFTQRGERYDLILAVNGDRSVLEYKRALTPTGICVVIGGSMKQIFQAMLLGPLLSVTGSQTLSNLLAKPNPRDLTLIAELLEARQITPVIDRCYPLHEVPDAMRDLEQAHARGKVIITLHGAHVKESP